MPANSDSALALAGQLRTLSDTDLAALLEAREIRQSGIKDFFDLADALLDTASVRHAIGRLDRPTLTTVAALAEIGAASAVDVAAKLSSLGAPSRNEAARLTAATRLALLIEVDGRYSVPAAVADQFTDWELLPDLVTLATRAAPTPLAPVSPVDARVTDGIAAENAFATTTSITELLAALQHESARELARGGVALPDSKRLAAAMGVDLDSVPGLLEIATRAGLTAIEAGRWMPTVSSSDWMIGSSGHRWSLLAGAWLDRLPNDIRAILASRTHATWGERLDEYVTWLFPAGGQWMRERVVVYTRDAGLLGITAHSVPSTPGADLLAEGPEAAGPVMAALFPTEVEQVYLQHDLTIVSPGPLAPRIDARLRTMSDAEGRALASTYRVSTPSLYRALAAGETSESIRSFLASISLSGIPQPLDYLLAEAAARYGLVRVGALDDGRSYVSSADATLLRTLLVDHSIAPLALGRPALVPGADSALAGSRLESRFDVEVVFWALSEARYPVAAEDAEGRVVVVARPRAVRASTVPASTSALTLIEKLRLASSADPDVTGRAWLSRQLDVAIKSKQALTVTVQMPNGMAVHFQLEPASVAGGRLRGRDRKADIERTLPLSSITALAPAE